MSFASLRRVTALVFLLLGLLSCGGTSSAGGSSCDAPTDSAAHKGECTLVDWDVVSVTENKIELKYYVNEPGCSRNLHRVEVDEDKESVRLKVVVGYSGEDGASCPTAYKSRTTTVTLESPLGERLLLGCRPVGSFVPQGGYNSPAPRNPKTDCTHSE